MQNNAENPRTDSQFDPHFFRLILTALETLKNEAPHMSKEEKIIRQRVGEHAVVNRKGRFETVRVFYPNPFIATLDSIIKQITAAVDEATTISETQPCPIIDDEKRVVKSRHIASKIAEDLTAALNNLALLNQLGLGVECLRASYQADADETYHIILKLLHPAATTDVHKNT